jgi:Tol biopolymer transport system component
LQTPAWSPDGKWIAFVRDAQVYKMPFDGERFDTTAIVQLTASGRNFFPAWSPDGNWIAYDSNTKSPTGLNFIWKMKSDGSAKSRIAFTPDAGETRAPSWGKNFSIVHGRYIGIVSTEIFTMDSAGNHVTRLTFNENQDSYSKYAPDSKHVGYISQSNKAGGIGLYTIDLATKATQRITSYDIPNFSWSPDGRIVFLRYDYSRIDQVQGTLWVMDADGSNQRQLTYNQFQITQ